MNSQAEVVLLEAKERGLLKQFLDAHMPTVAQQAEIDRRSIRTIPTALIDKLPIELLSSILYSAFTSTTTFSWHRRKQRLASVCRRWRDIILDNPRFWKTIHMASGIPSIKACLERSRRSPLDIVINIGVRPNLTDYDHFHRALDMALSHAHRWHSLEVNDSSHDNKNGRSLSELISERIDHLQFPSLRRVIVNRTHSIWNTTCLNFLFPSHSPALEHLELKRFVATPNFSSLTFDTPKPSFSGRLDQSTLSLPNLIVSQALTTLSLSGKADVFRLQPNSIPFPSLTTLEILNVTGARKFTDAIVAPNLERFNYISMDRSGDPPSIALNEFGSKFVNVHHLLFSYSATQYTPDLFGRDTWVLCQAFPGVRHVELRGGSLPDLFSAKKPDSNEPTPRPIGTWTELESLTLNGLSNQWLNPDHLLAWLTDRQALGLQRLHITLKGSSSSCYIEDQIRIGEFARLYEDLKEMCMLELVNVCLPMPTVSLSMAANSSLRVVSPI